MDDEAKIRILRRASIVMGGFILLSFAVAAYFAYYNLMTDRPAKEIFYPPAEGAPPPS